MNKLKPCPWCSNQGVFCKNSRGWKVQCAERFNGCPVNCRSHYHDEKEDAAKEWNTRPAPADAVAVVERHIAYHKMWEDHATDPKAEACERASKLTAQDILKDLHALPAAPSSEASLQKELDAYCERIKEMKIDNDGWTPSTGSSE